VPGLKTVTKRMPWVMALQAGLIAREHWLKLEPRERSELQGLIRKSKGRASNLSAKERTRAKALVEKLELAAFGRALVPVATGLRRKRRR
jgi:hypothetical protein